MPKTDIASALASLTNGKTDVTGVGIDGGLNLKTDPQRLPAPATTRADNAWHLQPGNVQQLPAFRTLFNDTPAPVRPVHIYNLAARDPGPPASTGDVLVHGEYADDPANTANGFTRAMWSANDGRTVAYENSVLPLSLRVRPMATNLGISATASNRAPTVYGNQLVIAREEGAVSKRRFIAGSIQNFVFQGTCGYVDGLTRQAAFTIGSNLVSCDLLGVQGANYAALLAIGSSNANLYYLDYATGAQLGNIPITSAPNYNAPNAQLFNHAGVTYAGTAGPTTNAAITFRNIINGVLQQVTVSTTTQPANFAVGSPYSHQLQSDTTYMPMVLNRTLYVLARDTTGFWRMVTPGISLAAPAVALTGGTFNYAATVSAMVSDNQGGVGPSARISIVVFMHFPEQAVSQGAGSGVGAAMPVGLQSVLCAKYTFTAAPTNPAVNTGSLTLVSNNVFRTVAGAGIVSRSFTTNPSEANYAGPTGAKQALCVVQSGATEPDSTAIYQGSTSTALPRDRESQPTYFVIDHNADIVGRCLEASAATRPAVFAFSGSQAGAFAPAFPGVGSLAGVLYSDGSGDDLAALNITVPVWGIAISTPLASYKDANNILYQNVGFATYTYTPQAITLTLNAANSAPPAVNSGSHAFMAGPCATVHDGNGMVEQNYHFGAMNFVLSGGIYTQPVFYNYYIVYKWLDAQGRQHRSTPSLATTTTVPLLTNQPTVNWLIPNLNTTKNMVGLNVTADIYTTLPNNTDGNAYYIDSVVIQTISKTISQPTMYTALQAIQQRSVAITDITRQPAIYTAPNVLSAGRTYVASPPRAFFYQIAAKGRIFALAQVSGFYRLYYSSVASDVLPYEWHPFNYAPVPGEVGDARSLEMIDDKIVVIGTRGNAVMSGDGPPPGNDVGSPAPNDGFSPVTPIPTPAGAVGAGAPARVPEGVLFQGFSGLQMVGRDLTTGAVGAPIDVLTGRQLGNPGTVYGRGMTVQVLQSVVWPNPRGAALVYSYLTQKWSTWPLLPGACSMVQKMDGSVYVALQPMNGTQMLPLAAGTQGADFGTLTTNVYSPIAGISSAPGLVLETPWVLLAGASTGEADLYDMALVGTWMGPHILQVEQAYNYGAYTLTQNIDMSLQPLTYQTRWRPLQNSRVWAVRYRISLLPVSTLNAGYPMADIADLVVYSDTNPGTTRVGQSQTR